MGFRMYSNEEHTKLLRRAIRHTTISISIGVGIFMFGLGVTTGFLVTSNKVSEEHLQVEGLQKEVQRLKAIDCSTYKFERRVR